MAKTWYQKQQEKEANKKASAGGAAENTGAESAPVGSSPAAPVAQDNVSVRPSTANLPDRTRLDNQKSAAEQARKPVTGASTIPHEVAGVPSREEQEKQSETVAAEAPAAVPGGAPANVMAASGDPGKRVAHSAPGGTITTKDGTFTQEQWAGRNKKPPKE
jgi:hypothetical protein